MTRLYLSQDFDAQVAGTLKLDREVYESAPRMNISCRYCGASADQSHLIEHKADCTRPK